MRPARRQLQSRLIPLTSLSRPRSSASAAALLCLAWQASQAQPAQPAADQAEASLPTVRATAKALATDSPLNHLSRQSASGALGDKTVLDTPFSITIIDSEQMLARGAKSIAQIFYKDPSVYTPTNASSTDWWGTQIRGLGVRNHYVDDIPMLLYWGGDFPTEVVDSVTALKGLAGFMYGFGEPGGALSYQLKRPGKTDATSVVAGYRSSRLWSAHVDASHRLGDDLAVRANLATEQGTANNAAEINRVVGSLAVDKQISAALAWQTTLVHEDSKTTGEPLQFYLDSYDVAGSSGRLPAVPGDSDKINVDNAYYHSKTTLASTALAWQIDDRWRLKVQAGLARKEHYSNKAFANLLNAAGDYSGQMYNFASVLDTLFSQAMLQGRVSVWGLQHEVVAGLGFQRSKDRWSKEFYWSNDFNGNIFVTQPFRVTRTPDYSLAPLGSDTEQWSGFVSDTVHINKQWQAIAGLRYTDYHLKDVDGDATIDSGYRTREASPTLALIYKPDPGTSIYGSYVEGLEPGNRVEQGGSKNYSNGGQVLGATVSKQMEIGVKHQAGKLDYSAALFHVQRANQMDALRDGALYLSQDGRLLYQGLELSAAYQLNRQLNVGLGAVYLHARIDKVSPENAGYEGNTPANAPRWQVVGHAQYRVPGVHGLKLHGDFRYFGKSYVSDDNLLTVPGRTVFNAGFSHDFRLQGRDLTLFANLNNVFNRKYWASGGWSAGTVGEARNLSLALRAQF